MTDKAIITCALTGVLTDPREHPVPVTPAELAASAREAWEAGAVCMHVHFRQQGEGRGHLPSWDPALAVEVAAAIRDACPGVILNFTTGVVGRDQSGPIACLRVARTRKPISTTAIPMGTADPRSVPWVDWMGRVTR